MVVRVDLDESTERRISEIAEAKGITASDVIRQALEEYASARDACSTWLERAESFGLIGCSDGGPPDLSTNKAYLENVGRD